MTHRSLIEPLSGRHHLKVMLLSRYVKFYRELLKSPKFTIKFLARLCERDLRTVMGRTLEYLLDECSVRNYGFDALSPQKVKQTLTYIGGKSEMIWRDDVAIELMNVRNGQLVIDGFTKDELDDLFGAICTQ